MNSRRKVPIVKSHDECERKDRITKVTTSVISDFAKSPILIVESSSASFWRFTSWPSSFKPRSTLEQNKTEVRQSQSWKMSGNSTAAEEMFHKIFPGNFLTPCMELLSSYILECHIIYLLFKNCKSVLQVEIVLCRDWSLLQCAAPYVLWNLPHAGCFIFD